MRLFHLSDAVYEELAALPEDLPPEGFLWIGLPRREFELQLGTLQQRLLRWTGAQLLDLHVSDLMNPQLPSHFDYTSWYDLMVFRRLATMPGSEQYLSDDSPRTAAAVSGSSGHECLG